MTPSMRSDRDGVAGHPAGRKLVVTPYGGPERLFGLHPVQAEQDGSRVEMPSGPWLLGEGGAPAAGSLGVLLDVGLGQSVVSCCAENQFSVTTEISIDLCAQVPVDGTSVRVESRLVSRDGAGGLAAGTVIDGNGRTIGIGSTWHRFSAGVPLTGEGEQEPEPSSPTSAGSLSELLDVRSSPGGTVSLPPADRFANPGGVLHGGILVCAADMAARSAVQSPDLHVAGIRLSYLRPGIGTVTVVPSVRHAGRALAIVDVEARREDDRLSAIGVVTFRSGQEPAG